MRLANIESTVLGNIANMRLGNSQVCAAGGVKQLAETAAFETMKVDNTGNLILANIENTRLARLEM